MPGVNKRCQSRRYSGCDSRLLVGISTCEPGRGRVCRNCGSGLYGITDGDLGLTDLLRLLCRQSLPIEQRPLADKTGA
jgi:hypothetical protein